MKLLPLLHEHHLNMVDALWLPHAGGHSYSKVPIWRFILLPLYTSLPTTHPPPSHPTHPHALLCWPYINAHLKTPEKHKNCASTINKVRYVRSYMKVNRLLCLLLLIQSGQLQPTAV